MKRGLFIILILTVATAAGPQKSSSPPGALPGLNRDQSAAFLAGQAAYNQLMIAGTGLGPVFNGRSCAECHPNGNGSVRISNVVGDAGQAQINAGGPVIQILALPGFLPEVLPLNVPIGRRRSRIVRGVGLMAAVPDDAILAEQTRQKNVFPQIAGKANLVVDAVTGQRRVGRVGAKSQHPNSTSFAAEAFLREMGITTPFFPSEEAAFNNPATIAGNPVPGVNSDGSAVILAGVFMDLLAPPVTNPPRTDDAKAQVSQGAEIFVTIGCAVCHTPTWVTGVHDVAALSEKEFHPFSDFLLHDMGASGDRVAQGTDAQGQPIPGSWMRTSPLWGCRQNLNLWHDGLIKARDYDAAINRHEGQGLPSKTQYRALTTAQKRALAAFLDSL